MTDIPVVIGQASSAEQLLDDTEFLMAQNNGAPFSIALSRVAAKLAMSTGGGLSAVASDGTLTGDGTSGDPLMVAFPFTLERLTQIVSDIEGIAEYQDYKGAYANGAKHVGEVWKGADGNYYEVVQDFTSNAEPTASTSRPAQGASNWLLLDVLNHTIAYRTAQFHDYLTTLGGAGFVVSDGSITYVKLGADVDAHFDALHDLVHGLQVATVDLHLQTAETPSVVEDIARGAIYVGSSLGNAGNISWLSSVSKPGAGWGSSNVYIRLAQSEARGNWRLRFDGRLSTEEFEVPGNQWLAVTPTVAEAGYDYFTLQGSPIIGEDVQSFSLLSSSMSTLYVGELGAGIVTLDSLAAATRTYIDNSGGGNGGGGLSAVASDATLTGDGTSGDPLKVAFPFTQDRLTQIVSDIEDITKYEDYKGDYVDGEKFAGEVWKGSDGNYYEVVSNFFTSSMQPTTSNSRPTLSFSPWQLLDMTNHSLALSRAEFHDYLTTLGGGGGGGDGVVNSLVLSTGAAGLTVTLGRSGALADISDALSTIPGSLISDGTIRDIKRYKRQDLVHVQFNSAAAKWEPVRLGGVDGNNQTQLITATLTGNNWYPHGIAVKDQAALSFGNMQRYGAVYHMPVATDLATINANTWPIAIYWTRARNTVVIDGTTYHTHWTTVRADSANDTPYGEVTGAGAFEASVGFLMNGWLDFSGAPFATHTASSGSLSLSQVGGEVSLTSSVTTTTIAFASLSDVIFVEVEYTRTSIDNLHMSGFARKALFGTSSYRFQLQGGGAAFLLWSVTAGNLVIDRSSASGYSNIKVRIFNT